MLPCKRIVLIRDELETMGTFCYTMNALLKCIKMEKLA